MAGRQARRRPLISLTPLIDVVFILLIFFMLVSSFADWRRIRLEPPVAQAGGGGNSGAMLVEIRADGRIRLSGVSLAEDQVAGRIADLLRRRPDLGFVVAPEEGVELQRLVAMLDRLSGAGAGSISLARREGG